MATKKKPGKPPAKKKKAAKLAAEAGPVTTPTGGLASLDAPAATPTPTAPPAAEPPAAPVETKVVVHIRATGTTIGVQRTDTDPRFETFTDVDPAAVLALAPGVLDRATAAWLIAKKNPAYARPAPQTPAGGTATPPPPSKQTGAGKVVPPAKAAAPKKPEPKQVSLF